MEPDMPEELLLSSRAAGTLLGVSEWTVERMARDGEVPFVRLRGSIRLDRRDILTLIDAKKKQAADEVAARLAARRAEAEAIRQEAHGALTQPKPKRGRGRPRKTVAAEATTTASTP